jgi:uncharacterized protein YbaP (TraB family)
MARVWLVAAAAALALWPGAAGAQRLEDPEANIVEELVIQAKEPGPAWWTVSDDDTTVYILGILDDRMPAGVTWDRRFLDRRLKGANSLIVGTRVSLSAKLKDIPALLRARKQLRSKTPLETTLPEPLRVRFVAARERAGLPAAKYAGWAPLLAGQQLTDDVRQKEGVTRVVDPILKAARREKVKIVDPARYEAMPFVRTALASLTPAVHEQCLDGALDDLEAPTARRRAAAQGWASGDVAAALTEPRSFEKCLLLLGGGSELWRRVNRDNAAAIAAALEKPGHSVAIVSLRPLLAEGGVVQELERRGLEVTGAGR